jgi:DnaK suppressor protein
MPRKEALQKLRQVLMRRRDALRRALAGDLSSLRELRDQGDVLDVALDTAQDELNSQLAEVESRELEQIEEALGKMKLGTYGKCDPCGKPIPLARLEALPYASECIECRRRSEGTSGGGGWSSWSGKAMDAGLSDVGMDAV